MEDGSEAGNGQCVFTIEKVGPRQSKDVTCGFWIFKGAWLQKFANKKSYVVLFGLLGCLYQASYSYFNGILSTVEKRFGIPSKVTGLITVGNDVSSLLVSTIITYYASKKHQPRWIGFGMYTIVIFCLMSALPHLIYGPGDDALLLTKEFGGKMNEADKALEGKKLLCKKEGIKCETYTSDSIVTPVILFFAQFVAGLGGSLYHTLGVSYMDDNVKRSKTPLLLSFTYFIRSLGPVAGYLVSSICLKLYVAPDYTPTIGINDPRWIGAWWIGWLVFAALIFVFSTLILMFPRKLPKTVIRENMAAAMRGGQEIPESTEMTASFADMVVTFKRLFKNRVLMCNNFGGVFYLLGAMPFFIFLPKYIEIIYAQSASFSSLITGTVGLACSSLGILLSGIFLSKYKPRARPLAMWNVIVGSIMVCGILTFAFLECPASANVHSAKSATSSNCSLNCHCDYVKYTPVCTVDGKKSFLSPCHAGCTSKNGTIYTECSCVPKTEGEHWDRVTEGACSVDCKSAFFLFLLVISVMQFAGSTGKTTNFLVAVRCVDDKDKPIAMGIGLTMISLAAFIPSPILFGYIIDKSCLVWGTSCTGKGNCLIYDSRKLRYTMNFTAAAFIAIGVLFDVGVWYLVKNIQIFDEEVETKNDKKTEEK